jgi:hypothetical protein
MPTNASPTETQHASVTDTNDAPGPSTEDIAHEVFNLLKRRTALCPSQISVGLGLSLGKIFPALELLMQRGLAEPRPDRHKTTDHNGTGPIWGLKSI